MRILLSTDSPDLAVGTRAGNPTQKGGASSLHWRIMPSDGPRCHPSLLPAR
jgi:hypothetical protein